MAHGCARMEERKAEEVVVGQCESRTLGEGLLQEELYNRAAWMRISLYIDPT